MNPWLPRIAVSGDLHDWLTTTGSLSERLRQACGDGFRVQPVFQAPARAILDEHKPLGLSGHGVPLVREVLLLNGNTPLVFARSLAAMTSLNGPWRGLRGLGSRPLASMLFADPGISRQALEFRRLTSRTPLFRRAASALPKLPAELWARRSVFVRSEAPLLVSEIFLPAILDLCQKNHKNLFLLA